MEDKQIVDLFWERSESAIEETTKKYGRYCKSIAFNILFNEQEVEESINDTYLQVWNSIPSNRPKIFSSYLGKIIRNIALNRYKKLRTKKRGGGEIELILEGLDQCIHYENLVEKEIETEFLATKISEFLRTLNDEHLAVFVGRYWNFESIANIANHVGISESKTKSIFIITIAKI